MSLGLFAKGLITSMAEFKVPTEILNSPHYFDAIMWVYIHMIVIGVMIALIGFSVDDKKKQKWINLLLFIITAMYVYLDFRTSDSALGNALYKGESSVAPAIIGTIVNLLFLQLLVRSFKSNDAQ